MDLGFETAGFDVVWANEYDRSIHPTYAANHPSVMLDRRSILDIPPCDIPSVEGFIGGPPCQAWSLIGSMRGRSDPRGKLFYHYVDLLKVKRPLFFVAENVPGIVSPRHKGAFAEIAKVACDAGYLVDVADLQASEHGVPQERRRVFLIGYRKDMGRVPSIEVERVVPVTMRDAIWGMPDPVPAMPGNRANPHGSLPMPNHEYFVGGFSSRFMSRNRRRSWDDVAFTVQASGRHAQLHPSSPPMVKTGAESFRFSRDRDHGGRWGTNIDGSPSPPPADPSGEVRRVSVRECARLQTFPDDFIFEYDRVNDGYKMVGNAVPVRLATRVAEAIRREMEGGAGWVTASM